MARILFGVTVPMTAEAFLKPQFKALQLQGWDVHLACSPDPGFESLQKIEGICLHAIPMKRNPSPIKDLLSLYEWHKLVRTIKPDMIVGSTPKAALLAMLAGKWNKVAARVYHARGFRAEGLAGLPRKVSLLAEKITARNASAVVCDSDSLRTELICAGILKQSKVGVLGFGSCCGVDINHFRPASREEHLTARSNLGINDRDFVVGFVGRIAVDKGINELMSAVKNARQKANDIILVLVGPLEDASLGERISANSEFISYVGSLADPRTAYWAFNCFVLPSYREGFGQSSLEAQACGIPTIVSNATGVRDSVPPNAPLPLVRVHDSRSITESICSLYADGSLRYESASLGREWVQNNFDSRQVVTRFNDYLIQQVKNVV